MSDKPVTSLSKALRLLRLMGVDGGWVGVRQLARDAGLTPSCTHNLLRGMLADGFVAYDAERRQYRLGLAILALADAIDAADAFGSFARPWIERLGNELGETVSAVSWRGGAAVVVAFAETRHDLRVVEGRQRVIDRPHIWASGQVLLAWQPEPERRSYMARMVPDAQQAGRLQGRLDEVRAQGWAECVDEAGSGLVAIGAPVMEQGGRCILAIGASAPLSRASPPRQREIRDRLLATAAAMGTEMGASG